MTYTITKLGPKTSRVCSRTPIRRGFWILAVKYLVIYLPLQYKMEVWAQSKGKTFQAAKIRLIQTTIKTVLLRWQNKEAHLKQLKACWRRKRPEYSQSPTHELELDKTTELLISCHQVAHWHQTRDNSTKWTSSTKTNLQFNKWKRTIFRTNSSFWLQTAVINYNSKVKAEHKTTVNSSQARQEPRTKAKW